MVKAQGAKIVNENRRMPVRIHLFGLYQEIGLTDELPHHLFRRLAGITYWLSIRNIFF